MPNSTCRWPECDANGDYCRSYCSKHYMRAYKLGDFEAPWVEWEAQRTPPPCKWPGCAASSKNRGLCPRDYSRAVRRKNFDDPWVGWADPGGSCKWPTCERKSSCKGLCEKHYSRARKVSNFDAPWIRWGQRMAELYPAASCKWPECGGSIHAQGFCTRHYGNAKLLADFDSPWVEWEKPRMCEWCGVEFRRTQRTAMFCTPTCSVRSYDFRNPQAAKKRAAKWDARNLDKRRMMAHRRRAWKLSSATQEFTTHDVRVRHGDNCYLCEKPINFRIKYPNPQSPSLDHVVAISRGGPHTLENVAMTHLVCNLRKGAREAAAPLVPTLFNT